MKHTIRWLAVTVLASAVCSFITYKIPYPKAYLSGAVDHIHEGSKVTSFLLGSTLRELRSGDGAGATSSLERLYFHTAENFFHDPRAASEHDAKRLAEELVQYRSVYRTNSADWDTFEQKLEKQLAAMK